MALDFPNAPTLNQTFTAPNGTIWLWDGVKWTATTSTSPFTGQGNVGRNLIHNPLFAVAQRGAGPFTTNTYTADRWMQGFTGGTQSTSIVALTDADRTAIGDEAAVRGYQTVFAGGAVSTNSTAAWQGIEGVRRLSGRTLTLSFWAKAASGTPKLGFSLDQIFGTGGSPSATISGTGQSVTLSTTFARYTLSFTMPSATGKTFGTNGDDAAYLDVWFSAGTSNATVSGSVGVQSGTIQLWGVQLEIGSVATPLEKPDPRYDLSNCQRFYQLVSMIHGMNAGAGGTFYASTNLPVTMRAQPVIGIISDASSGFNARTFTANGPGVIFVSAAPTAANTGVLFNASLSCSADL